MTIHTHFLTYSAQVRQNRKIYPNFFFWKDSQKCSHALIAPHILRIKPSKKRGISRKVIAIIGTVRDADLVGQNKSMGAWLRDAENWLKPIDFTSSQLPVVGRKLAMNMLRNTMENGRTGFWMRVGQDGNARAVNGTMYKLLNAKKGNILTHILSPHMHRMMLRSILYAARKKRRADNTKTSYPSTYGLIGLKARSKGRGWASNTTLVVSKAQREHRGMSPNTYLNPPFSRMIGLPDGSAYDTVKAFQKRRRAKQTQSR